MKASSKLANNLPKFPFILMAYVISATFILAACDGSQKGAVNKIRDNSGTQAEGSLEHKLETKMGSEAVAALALTPFLELHRATDILLNGNKAKSLMGEKGCQKVDVNEVNTTRDELTVKTNAAACKKSNQNWSAEEIYIRELDAKKIVRTAKMTADDPPISLLGDSSFEINLAQTIRWEKKGDHDYAYEQILDIDLKQKNVGGQKFYVTLKNAGVLTVDEKTNEINKVIPQVLEFTKPLRTDRGDKTFKTLLQFKAMPEAAVICGRPIGDWVSEQSFSVDDKEEQPYKLVLSSDAKFISTKKTKSKFSLANCGKGFAALQSDLGKIGRSLQTKLGK